MRRLQGSPAVDSPPFSVDYAAVRREAYWVVAGQVLVALVGGLLWYVGRDTVAALSALSGGGIGAAATLAQVWVGLRNSAGREPREVVRGFYRGTAVKFAVTVVLFVWALRSHRLAAGPLFSTYVVTFLVYWVALARGSSRKHVG
jgi:ATP synthase protein I